MTPAPLDLLALAYIVEQYAEDLPIIAIRFPGESDTELRVRLSKWRGAPAESVAEHAASLENYMPPRCTRQEEVMASMRQVDKTRASKAVGEYKEKPTEASGRMVPCSKSQWHSFHPASEDCKECDPPKLTLAKLPQEYPTPEDCLYVDVLSGTVHDTYLMSKRWMRNSAQHVPLSSIKPGTVEAKRVCGCAYAPYTCARYKHAAGAEMRACFFPKVVGDFQWTKLP